MANIPTFKDWLYAEGIMSKLGGAAALTTGLMMGGNANAAQPPKPVASVSISILSQLGSKPMTAQQVEPLLRQAIQKGEFKSLGMGVLNGPINLEAQFPGHNLSTLVDNIEGNVNDFSPEVKGWFRSEWWPRISKIVRNDMARRQLELSKKTPMQQLDFLGNKYK